MKIIFGLLDKNLSTTKMGKTLKFEKREEFLKDSKFIALQPLQDRFHFSDSMTSKINRYAFSLTIEILKYLNSKKLCLNLKHVIFFQNNKHSN